MPYQIMNVQDWKMIFDLVANNKQIFKADYIVSRKSTYVLEPSHLPSKNFAFLLFGEGAGWSRLGEVADKYKY